MDTEIVWEGEWEPVMDFLDRCSGGGMTVPLGHMPPVRRREEFLVALNRNGEEMGKVGDRLVFDRNTGEFHIEEA